MPFDSEKQRRFLWANKPEVAKQIAYKNHGGEMMDDRKPSKVIKKDRYGNQVTFEYAPEMKPLDPTALAKHAMDNDMEVPEISMIDIDEGHPGEPKGSDTVPAWLTPGEFVVNAEAMRLPGAKEAVESINNQGRAVQQMQGGSIPHAYEHGGAVQMHRMAGGIPMDGPPHLDSGGDVNPLSIFNPLNLFSTPEERRQAEEYQKYHVQPKKEEPKLQISPIDILKLGLGFDQGGNVPFIAGPRLNAEYLAKGDWVTDELLDKLMEVESGGREDAVSPAGAVGLYQWLPSSAAKPGYGVKAFDPKDKEAARKATKEYLKGMQKYHGFSPEETLRAYNWGPGNVIKHKKGTRKDIPDEALNYPGKILGIENTVGVPAPEGMPVPTARPGSIQAEAVPTPKLKPSIDVPTPTPRPQPEEEWQVVKDLRSMWDAIKGPRYKQEGGITKPHFDTLAANYTPPELPSNVVPELTDVPQGHKMFGGNETFAGSVNAADPNLVDDLSGSTTGEVVPESVDTPWYSDLLGHKSKEALNIPLNENEKRLADEATSTSEKLAGPEIAEEENFIADIADTLEEEDIEGTGMKVTKDKKDVLIPNEDGTNTIVAKADVKKKVMDKVDKDTKNAPEVTASDKEIEAVVKKDPSTLNKAEGFLKGILGDLFDTKELKRAAVMYAGSRLLGYNHQGSLRHSLKGYIGRIDSKAAARDSFIKSNAKNYTSESLQAYKESGDLTSLKPVGTPTNVTGEFKSFYKNGKEFRAQKYKVGKNSYWSADGGKTPINSSYHENASAVKGTKEYNQRVSSEAKDNVAVIKDLQSRFDEIKGKDGKPSTFRTEISPALQGKKIAEWAAENDVDAAQVGSLMEQAYHDAINDSAHTGRKPRDLTPYLNSLIIREHVGTPSLFQVKENEDGSPVYVSGAKMRVVNRNILARAGLDTNLKDKRNVDKLNNFWTFAQSKWAQLPDKERAQWNRKGGEDTTGFYEYVKTQLES